MLFDAKLYELLDIGIVFKDIMRDSLQDNGHFSTSSKILEPVFVQGRHI